MKGIESMENKYGQKWSREETILAFYYYSKIPFGKLHKGNPDIIRIAQCLGRTPSSVSMKMCNFAHFDPSLEKRNIVGMANASKLDREIVSSFFNNWEELTYEADRIEKRLTESEIPHAEIADIELPVGSTKERTVKARVNQRFFRDSVLTSYQNSCCITHINIPSLLIASHIKPWNVSDPATERTNPCNGLCLNALHDKAFDQGLITVLPDFTIRVSSKLDNHKHIEAVGWLIQYDRQRIHLPERFLPMKEFLEYHNDVIFVP